MLNRQVALYLVAGTTALAAALGGSYYAGRESARRRSVPANPMQAAGKLAAMGHSFRVVSARPEHPTEPVYLTTRDDLSDEQVRSLTRDDAAIRRWSGTVHVMPVPNVVQESPAHEVRVGNLLLFGDPELAALYARDLRR